MANVATLKSSKPQIPHPAAAVSPTLASARLFAMCTHPGRIRHANQDACAALLEHGAFIVCDGVGGAAAGEVASNLAAETFLAAIAQSAHGGQITPKSAPRTQPDDAQDTSAHYPAGHPYARLQQAVCAANRAVFQRSQRFRTMRGMGTTLVAMLWENTPNSTPWVAHVGDSRAYLFRHGSLEPLTRDHSLVEEQIRAGLIHRDQAEFSPIRNVITRAIGTQPVVEAEIAAHSTLAGDLFLLASDGLTRELADSEIATILSRVSGQGLESTCQELIDAANTRGGRDNITVLLVGC